jgi:hypothetical protein
VVKRADVSICTDVGTPLVHHLSGMNARGMMQKFWRAAQVEVSAAYFTVVNEVGIDVFRVANKWTQGEVEVFHIGPGAANSSPLAWLSHCPRLIRSPAWVVSEPAPAVFRQLRSSTRTFRTLPRLVGRRMLTPPLPINLSDMLVRAVRLREHFAWTFPPSRAVINGECLIQPRERWPSAKQNSRRAFAPLVYPSNGLRNIAVWKPRRRLQ